MKGRETTEELTVQKNELRKLYLNSFEQFAKILKPGGHVLFIFPRFKTASNWISTECADELKKFNFKTEEMLPGHKSLVYMRPDQKIAREIIKFRYK